MIDQKNLPSRRKKMEAHAIARSQHDDAFREELKRDPKGVAKREYGIEIPDHVKIHVHEEGPNDIHFVLPRKGRS